MPVFLRRILAFCAMALVAAGTAQAADYPSHPVRVLVGYAPGGTTDFSGRLIAQALSAQLKQPFVVENMVGASGTKAAEEVVHSAPDGYTLYVADSTFSMLPWVYGQLKWKPESDLKLAAMIMQAPAVLVVAPGSPFKSVREIIEHARQHPDQLSYGSAGVGTSVHLYAELFQQQAKIKLVHREFNGSGEAVKAVQSGKVDLMFTALPSALKSLKEGKLRALALSSDRRLALLPEVETFRENGMRGYLVASWFGLMVPKDTPAAVIERLNSEVRAALATPQVRQQLADNGGSPSRMSVAEAADFFRVDTQIWGAVTTLAGIKPGGR